MANMWEPKDAWHVETPPRPSLERATCICRVITCVEVFRSIPETHSFFALTNRWSFTFKGLLSGLLSASIPAPLRSTVLRSPQAQQGMVFLKPGFIIQLLLSRAGPGDAVCSLPRRVLCSLCCICQTYVQTGRTFDHSGRFFPFFLFSPFLCNVNNLGGMGSDLLQGHQGRYGRWQCKMARTVVGPRAPHGQSNNS
jgi:hypothetical protein